MNFYSILFEGPTVGVKTETIEPPEFFIDLNLDQIIEILTLGRQEYNLKPFFYTPLNNIDTITYRHEIMRDLENRTISDCIKSFTNKMKTMREHLVQKEKLYYKYQIESWFLDVVGIYCDAIICLDKELAIADLKSHGLLAFHNYLLNYIKSEYFMLLIAETKKIKTELTGIEYCMFIKGNTIKVRKYESEIDYSEDVEKTFEKFKHAEVKDYSAMFSSLTGMNHVEAKVLDFVAKLFPDIFLDLDNYYVKHNNYLDETIGRFDREIQFYIAYLEYMVLFQQNDLEFSYPKLSKKEKEIYNYKCFDLALAYKLVNEKQQVVCNDFYLKDSERIFVVSGPNQGGKTTFARTFGQLHYIASLGLPVPGTEAQLFLFDKLFTHFEKEEDISNLRGKLQDDLVRIYHILNQATPDSIIIMNEIFTSTTLQDAIFLSKKIMEKIIQLDLISVCVSFIDELSSLNEKTVSMVSMVVPENPAIRTFRIERKPADGLSYALSIAEKYRLTYSSIMERLEQ